ncbi:MAG: 2-hydroxyacid dehydrogenase [Geminicoccaceae bacterium]
MNHEPVKTILLNGPVARCGLDLTKRYYDSDVDVDVDVDEITGNESDDERVRKFAEAEVLVTVNFDSKLPPTPKLRLIHLPASGMDLIDFSSIPSGCRVCNAFEHDIGISEYVMSAMLHFTVDLERRSARFKAGDWTDTPQLFGAFRPELAGKTLGCVGYGTIGRAVAKRAKAFGMQIMAVTRLPRPFDPEPDWLAGFGLTEALAEASDFILVACPLNAETRGLLGKRYIKAMKPSAVLINVARGPVVDEDVLYEALRSNKIGGAALDTWYHYPTAENQNVKPSKHPFETLDNVIMTPHCSGWTEGLIARRFAVIIDNIDRLADGRDLVNQVYPAE